MCRLFIALGFLLLLSGCQPLSVSSQSDPYADFYRYQRFNWMPEKESPSAEKALLEQQFKFAVERELLHQGIIRDIKQADFLIGFYATQEQKTSKHTVESVNYWGGRGRYSLYEDPRYIGSKQRWPIPSPSYTRSSETRTIEYKEGSLVIDFVDAETKQLFWQARIEGVIDEQDPVGQLDQAVIKALKQFPPQK